MQKFMCTHSFPPGQVTREQIESIGQAAQQSDSIRGYRSFVNLSEGKLICVMESPDRSTLASWFQQMNVPFDTIIPVELEGERGQVEDVSSEAAPAKASSIWGSTEEGGRAAPNA